jgi:energy-coupling factor transporter ATP-binding protein EcfA2
MTRPSYMPPPRRRGRENRLIGGQGPAPLAAAPRAVSVPDLRDTTHWDALAASEAPRVPWEEFMRQFQWKQGQHVSCIGQTGSGKTTLMRALLPLRNYVAIFGTKPVDENLERFQLEGYDLYTEWLSVDANKSPRRILWPDARELGAAEKQKIVFSHAMGAIYREGNWCVATDEGWYLGVRLKLADEMRDYWTQGRSLGLSFYVNTQRPAWVPLEMYSEATHLFFWRTVEKNAVERISNLGGANEALVKHLVRRLEEFQVLYVNKVTGQMMRTHAPYVPPMPHDQTPNITVRR